MKDTEKKEVDVEALRRQIRAEVEFEEKKEQAKRAMCESELNFLEKKREAQDQLTNNLMKQMEGGTMNVLSGNLMGGTVNALSGELTEVKTTLATGATSMCSPSMY